MNTGDKAPTVFLQSDPWLLSTHHYLSCNTHTHAASTLVCSAIPSHISSSFFQVLEAAQLFRRIARLSPNLSNHVGLYSSQA